MKDQKKTCPWCKKEFISNHASRKYCSNSCRNMACHKRNGYKVITVLPDEKTPPVKQDKAVATHENQASMNKSNPRVIDTTKLKARAKAEDFAANTGAGMLANYLTERLKSEPNKAATKQDILDIHVRIDQLFQVMQENNSNTKNNKVDISNAL